VASITHGECIGITPKIRHQEMVPRVEYTATLLGDGATDDAIRTLMGNMTPGATQEFPMVRIKMLFDAIQHRMDQNPMLACTTGYPGIGERMC
jgi:hypothetical protein